VGLSRLYLSGFTGTPPSRQIAKTALGADERVRWERAEAGTILAAARREYRETVAVETVDRASDVFDWRPRFPVLVFFGHEVEGLPEAIIAGCDTRVRIPMVGSKRSLNVATAGGVVLYELFRKHRELTTGRTGGDGDPRGGTPIASIEP
jgi:tRNA G18 (ribose-2'-O)-methylase SpoU